jgi:membrane-associated phospholipid phosphatase
MDFLLNLDTQLFNFVNVTLATPITGKFFALITESSNWSILYIFSALWLLFFDGKRGRVVFATLIVGILLTDQVSSHIIKDLVGRLRPCQTLEHINLLVNCGSGKSFPSSHAANNFFAAFILSFFYKKNPWVFYTTASLIAISRVVVGVHYPFDVIGGAIIGTAIALLLRLILVELFEKRLKFVIR